MYPREVIIFFTLHLCIPMMGSGPFNGLIGLNQANSWALSFPSTPECPQHPSNNSSIFFNQKRHCKIISSYNKYHKLEVYQKIRSKIHTFVPFDWNISWIAPINVNDRVKFIQGREKTTTKNIAYWKQKQTYELFDEHNKCIHIFWITTKIPPCETSNVHHPSPSPNPNWNDIFVFQKIV